AMGVLDGLDHSPLVDPRRGDVQAAYLTAICAWMRRSGCFQPFSDGSCLGAACCVGMQVPRAWISVVTAPPSCRATRHVALNVPCHCRYLRRSADVVSAKRHPGMLRGRLFATPGRWTGWKRVSNSVATLPQGAPWSPCGNAKACLFHYPK